MISISIIGLGTMTRVIVTRAVEGGHAVEVIGRNAAKVLVGTTPVLVHNTSCKIDGVHDDWAQKGFREGSGQG